jgi:hypothetical protein
MGDFFTRLAVRTLGLAPVVQPDLMPVLLPVAESVLVSDAIPRLEESLEPTTPIARESAPHEVDPMSRSMIITESATSAGETPQSLTQGWIRQLLRRRAVGVQSIGNSSRPTGSRVRSRRRCQSLRQSRT